MSRKPRQAMSKINPRSAKPGRVKVLKERRSPRGAPGSVGWLKSLMGRPLALERRGGQLHVTLRERRRSPEAIKAEQLAQLREELGLRLLGQADEQHTAVMRHLVFVHDMLGRQGWPGVAAMDSKMLARALVQAQMLASHGASPGLSTLIEQLRLFQVAAELREERTARAAQLAHPSAVEVSESTHEEFQNTERSWLSTVSPQEEPPNA
jgi:hypothetical protein